MAKLRVAKLAVSPDKIQRRKEATELKAQNIFTLALLVPKLTKDQFESYYKLMETSRSLEAQKKLSLLLNSLLETTYSKTK